MRGGWFGRAGTALRYGCDLDLVRHVENGVPAVPASHEVPAGQGPSVIDDADEPRVIAFVDDVEQIIDGGGLRDFDGVFASIWDAATNAMRRHGKE
jgi:hypothetical protein